MERSHNHQMVDVNSPDNLYRVPMEADEQDYNFDVGFEVVQIDEAETV